MITIKHPHGDRVWPVDYIAQPDPEMPNNFYLAPITRERTPWEFIRPTKSSAVIRTVKPEHDTISLLRYDLHFLDLDMGDEANRQKLMGLIAECVIYDERGTFSKRGSAVQYILSELARLEDWNKFKEQLLDVEEKLKAIELLQADDDIVEYRARQEEGYIAQPEKEIKKNLKKLVKGKKKKGRPRKRKDRADLHGEAE